MFATILAGSIRGDGNENFQKPTDFYIYGELCCMNVVMREIPTHFELYADRTGLSTVIDLKS